MLPGSLCGRQAWSRVSLGVRYPVVRPRSLTCPDFSHSKQRRHPSVGGLSARSAAFSAAAGAAGPARRSRREPLRSVLGLRMSNAWNHQRRGALR
jgi:hypothetical protein